MHFTQKSLERSEMTCKKNAMQDTPRGADVKLARWNNRLSKAYKICIVFSNGSLRRPRGHLESKSFVMKTQEKLHNNKG